MKRYVDSLVLVLVLSLTACSAFSPICFVQKRFVAVAASKVAEFGKCRRPSIIEKDFNGLLAKVTNCSAQQAAVPTGTIADLVCPHLSGMVGGFVGKQIPASWECDPTISADFIAQAFEKGCKLIPVDSEFDSAF